MLVWLTAGPILVSALSEPVWLYTCPPSDCRLNGCMVEGMGVLPWCWGAGVVILTARESRRECPPEQGADILPSLCTANALRSAALLIFFNKWAKTHTELLWNTLKQARYFCFQEFKVAPLRDFISNIHHFIWKYCQTSLFKALLLQPESLWKRGIFSLIIKVAFDLRG